MLYRHPKYRQEIRAATNNLKFDLDTLLSLEEIQNVLCETLRIYPIFHIMARITNRDMTLPVGGGPR